MSTKFLGKLIIKLGGLHQDFGTNCFFKKYFFCSKILVKLRLFDIIHRLRLFYILQLMCKKKYRLEKSILNRPIAYFHYINFL